MNNNRIGVIGTGRLGLSFALLCEHSGYEVVGYDIRQNYLDSLRDKSFSSPEPMVNEYLQAATHFMVTDQLKEVVELCDTIFCFVQTPSLEDGSYNHTYIEDVIDGLSKLYYEDILLKGKLLVIGCTTMPGYCIQVAERLEAFGMDLIYNPEFIAQGSIIKNLKEADMVLLGSETGRGIVSLQSIYRSIMTIPLKDHIMSTTAAEITKISINCFLTTKVAYANMIGDIAISSGVGEEVDMILQAIGDDSRIGHKFLKYGFSVGGVCLPRDNRALAVHAKDVNADAAISIASDEAARIHGNFLLQYLMQCNPDKEYPFIFNQLSYKKGLDILTESRQLELLSGFLSHGYKVIINESDKVLDVVREMLAFWEDRVIYNSQQEGYIIDLI